jgi:hypothetical protein
MGTPVYPLDFARQNLAASLTDSVLESGGVGGGADYLVPYPGEINALTVCANAGRTAGTATFEVKLNGVKVAAPVAVLNAANPLRHGPRLPYGGRPVAANVVKEGDVISVVVTTSADWAPTTADLTATVWLTSGGYEP